MKIGILLIALSVFAMVACSPESPSSGPKSASETDSIHEKYLESKFVADADYGGAGTALLTGATQVSLDVLEALHNKNVKQALAIVNSNKSVLKAAVSADHEKAKTMETCPLPNEIDEAKKGNMELLCKYSAAVHKEQAAAFQSLLEANDSNAVTKLNAFVEHTKKAQSIMPKADAVAHAITD